MPPLRLLLNEFDIARVSIVAAALQPPLADRELARRPCAQRGKHLVRMCYGLTADETVGMLIEKCLALVPCAFHNTYVDENHQMTAETRLRLLDKLIKLEPALPPQYIAQCSYLRSNIIAASEGAGHAETTEPLAATPISNSAMQSSSAAHDHAPMNGSGTTAEDPIVVSDSDSGPRVASSSRKRKRARRAEPARQEAGDTDDEGWLAARAVLGGRATQGRSAHATKRQRVRPTDD